MRGETQVVTKEQENKKMDVRQVRGTLQINNGEHSYSCTEILRSTSAYKGINGNFLERTQTVVSGNINILYFSSNTDSHGAYLNMSERA